MRLARYSIQWRNLHGDWIYIDRMFLTLRGAAKHAVHRACHKRSVCSFRVMKLVKGSDVVMFTMHKDGGLHCNCPKPNRRKRR